VKKKTYSVNGIEAQYEALARAYGPLRRLARQRALDVLVRTILSQNTSDINSNRAFSLLRKSFPRWEQVMDADPALIAEAIRCGGLANIKAGRIRETLLAINDREGKLSLSRLAKMDPQQALSYLISLPGVGVKTACCVLLFAFGMPVMPVDTHVYRVALRMGWIKPGIKIDEAHEHLERIVPARLILPMHLYVIMHGRRLCRPANPKCLSCPISRDCAYARTTDAP
jgi:endonuclease III